MTCCRYGKLSYFLTLAPYVIITTLLAYTATLEGFMDGVNYYLTPEWSKLGDLEVCVTLFDCVYTHYVGQIGEKILPQGRHTFTFFKL